VSRQSPSPPLQVPRWVRATLALDRALAAGARAAHVLIEETLAAWLTETERDAVTAEIYGRQSSYGPRGAHFEAGLFDWEERALEVAGSPPGGTLLLGGAGGGRELAALVARGFEVVAFEPSELVEQAASLPLSRATVVRASYADLVRAVEEGSGPLAPHLRAFDGVVLGWTSLMHVTGARSRERLLRAIRACAPEARVLASFWTPASDAASVRARVRRALSRLGARAEPGLRFAAHAGFYQPLDRDALEALARATGYRVALYEERGAGHAVLAPAR
jgi:SAM-dependent methyltransferase